MATISDIFSALGIPESVWLPIEQTESGGDPNAYTKTPMEESVGLFQLNRMGGLGTGYTVGQLKDPTFNATIAAEHMAPAYAAGKAKGLTGYSLTQYVAYNAGWPTQAGVKALGYDSTVQAYDTKLSNQYKQVAGEAGVAGATGSLPASTVASSTPVVGVSSQLQSLQGVAQGQGTGWTAGAQSIGLMVLLAGLGLIFLFVGLKLISGGGNTATIIKEAASSE